MSDSVFLTDGNGTLTKLIDKNYDGELIIPEYVAGERITRIGDFAFNSCGSLISIIIPNSVTRIGNGAFYDCSNLTSITIPNSVTTIGDEAFGVCTSLVTVCVQDINNLPVAVSSYDWSNTRSNGVTFAKGYFYVDESSGTLKPRIQNNNVDLQKILDMILALGLVDVPSLITFTIDSTEYQAEEGMAWDEWVESDYNTGDFEVGATDGLVLSRSTQKYVHLHPHGAILSTALIIANATYVLISGVGGGSDD